MDLYTFTAFACIVVSMVGVSYHTGHLEQITHWTNKQWKRTMTIMDLMTKYLDNTTQAKIASINISDDGTCVELKYNYFNESYSMILPFQRKHVAGMVMFTAELIKSDGSVIDITQQPGIPYLMTAEELGAQCIRITNKGTGQSREYNSNERPMYAEDVMDNE